MAQLTRVSIERFKSINNADFNLSGLNIFVGGNNSGKSSVIQAIHFAFTLFQSLEISKKWPSRNQRSSTISPEELIYVPSLDPYSLGKDGKLRESEEQAITLNFFFSDETHAALKIRKGRITNVLVEPTNVPYLRSLSGLNEPFSIFSPGLAGVSKSEQYVSDGVLLRALSRGDANSFLRNILLRLHKASAWNSFVEDLSLLFPSIQFHIEFDLNVDEAISVEIEHGGVRVPLDLAGTGLLQAIQILAYLNLFKPKIMLFDEPDSHLHPDNQRNLCSLFRAISIERNTQVILTTHSRHMIDSLADEANFIWMQNGCSRPATKEDQIDLLVDLGALDVRERLADSSAKFVFLTEDSALGPLKKVVMANGFADGEFVIYAYKGVTGIHLLDPLIRQIRDVSQGIIVVHRDRDYLEPDEVTRWEGQIRSLGAEPFVTADRDIEGYQIEDRFLQNYLRSHNLGELDELKKQVTENELDSTVEKYVNSRVDIERKEGRGNKINHGQLASAASRLVRADVWAMMLPKVRRRRIRDFLQKSYGHRLRDPDSSELSKDQTLSSIRNRYK